MKLVSNHGSSNGRYCFLVFLHFCQTFCNSFFLRRKSGSERMSGSSQTYLFDTNYNIDPSTMVTRYFKNMRFFC